MVAVLTLALGIGANAAIFTVIRAVLLKSPPYADADRLVLLGEKRPDASNYSGAISAPNYLDWVHQNTVFEQMAAVTGGGMTLSGGSTEPVYVDGRTVSASYFDVFGIRAAVGRTFAPDEDQPAKPHVVILSHRLWASQFGSDSAVIGKPVRLDGELYTVIGVMPAGVGVDLLDPELWTPRDLGRQGGALTPDRTTNRGRRDLNRAVAKLKRGVTLEEARVQMDVIIAYAMLKMMTAAIVSTGISKAVPSETTMSMDSPVWLLALVLSVLSGVAFGLGPSLRATRTALAGSIKERGGPGISEGRAHQRLRQNLVIAEVALAFVLMITSGLLIQGFVKLQERSGTGFDATNVLTARLPIPSRRFDDPKALSAYLDHIADRIQVIPGIRDVAFAEGLPTQGAPFGRSFQRADQPPIERARRPVSAFKTVSPSYFRAVGLRVLKGRALADRDREGAPFVVVINETFARTYFSNVEPMGRRLLMAANSRTTAATLVTDVPWEVVGVVADEGLSPWTRAAEPMIYATREQNPSDYVAMVVRGTVDPARLHESIRKAVSEVDRDQALSNVQSLDQLTTNSMASDRVRSLLLAAFAAVAVALAAVGLYGVLAYTVVQRTREIGIRAALGASTASLVALVVRQGMLMTGWGLAVGLGGGLIVSRLLTAFLFGVGPSDPTTIAAVAGMMAAVALTACYIPARRAAKVDPLIALRSE
jgi:ABC-type antimicrobial peptide transport system permease subunit